jgi:hypothetical protein
MRVRGHPRAFKRAAAFLDAYGSDFGGPAALAASLEAGEGVDGCGTDGPTAAELRGTSAAGTLTSGKPGNGLGAGGVVACAGDGVVIGAERTKSGSGPRTVGAGGAATLPSLGD